MSTAVLLAILHAAVAAGATEQVTLALIEAMQRAVAGLVVSPIVPAVSPVVPEDVPGHVPPVPPREGASDVEKRRRYERERKRRQRAASKMSRAVPGHVPPTTKKALVGVLGAGAAEPILEKEASAPSTHASLADEVALIAGVAKPDDDGECRYWRARTEVVADWLAQGADAGLIRAVVKQETRKLAGRGPPWSPRFFDNAIARAITKAKQRPLPGMLGMRVVARTKDPPSTVPQVTFKVGSPQWRERLAYYDQHNPTRAAVMRSSAERGRWGEWAEPSEPPVPKKTGARHG